MSSLNPTEVSAIAALLALQNSDHIVDFNVLSDLPSDSIDNLDNFDTQPIDTDFFLLNDNSKEKDHRLGKTITKDIAPEGIYYLCTALQKQKPTFPWKIVDPPQLNRRNTGQNISPTFQKKVFRQFRYQRMGFFTTEMRTFP